MESNQSSQYKLATDILLAVIIAISTLYLYSQSYSDWKVCNPKNSYQDKYSEISCDKILDRKLNKPTLSQTNYGVHKLVLDKSLNVFEKILAFILGVSLSYLSAILIAVEIKLSLLAVVIFLAPFIFIYLKINNKTLSIICFVVGYGISVSRLFGSYFDPLAIFFSFFSGLFCYILFLMVGVVAIFGFINK
jgi:hypothetical protein